MDQRNAAEPIAAAILRAAGRSQGDESMTGKQKELLAEFAKGADVNMTASIARAMGKREENNTARTIMALFRAKMLQIATGGGLEISQLGRDTAAKNAAREKAGAK